MAPLPTTLFLAGPTASGKSATAAELARRHGGEVVNADAFQLYDGLPILTAQPTGEEQSAAPHHLFGTVPLDQNLDAAAYADLARPVIDAITARGNLPIVVGGSGLYLKALTHGLADLPQPDPELRARLAATPLDDLVAQLHELDPESAATINLKNPRYVARAVEISLLTGQPASVVKQSWQATPDPDLAAAVLSFDDRETLYARINARTHQMLEDGVLAELEAARPHLSETAAKAIGVREFLAHLDGQLPLEEAVTAVQQATRHYAKRQMNWFRRESAFQTICLTSAATSSSAADAIAERFPALFRS